MFYFFYFISQSSILYISYKSTGLQRKLFVFTFFFLMFIFSGLRGDVGLDTLNYTSIYNSLDSYSGLMIRASSIEPLFLIISYIHKNYIDNETLYFLLISFFQALLLYRLIKRFDNLGSFIFLLFYSFIFYLEFHFNVVRVSLAVLLLLNSLVNCGSNKKKLLFILPAMFVHFSIVPFIPIIFIDKARLNSLKFILLFLFSLLLLILVFNLMGDYFTNKLDAYSEYTSEGISITSYFFSFLVLVSYTLKLNKSRSFNICCIMIIFILLARMYYPIFYRFYHISLLFYLYFLCIDLNINTKISKYACTAILMLALNSTLSMTSLYNQSEHLKQAYQSGRLSYKSMEFGYIPYEFYWEDK